MQTLENAWSRTRVSQPTYSFRTSITANLSEAAYGHSKKDFYAKTRIALKECAETHTWLRLLHATDSLADHEYQSINTDCEEILKILIAISKTAPQ